MTRIGRFLSVDPVLKAYESPYSAFGNNPINTIDPDGADTIDIKRKTTVVYLKGFNDGHSDNLVTPNRIDVSHSGDIVIKQASGEDVFRITDIRVSVDENGIVTTTSNPVTLVLNNKQTFYRTGERNLEPYIDDRFALASNAPTWLLKHYADKSGDIVLHQH